MTNKEEDIGHEYLYETENDNQESQQRRKQQEIQNLVKIGAMEIDSYANIALRYMEKHGSAVIAARGHRCGKAIMVWQLLRDIGLILTEEGPFLAIGEDQMGPTKKENRNTGILTLGKPFIRITVFPRKRFTIFPRKSLTNPVLHA